MLQGFGSGRAAGVASVRWQKLLPLAKPTPISNVDSASVITYLRKGKKTLQQQLERGEKQWEQQLWRHQGQ